MGYPSRPGLFLWACVCSLSLYDWKTVYTGANPVAQRQPTFDWEKASNIPKRLRKTSVDTDPSQLAPSTALNWTSCFENYTCTKLEVPLDYENPSIGSTGIAFIKLAAQNNSNAVPNILINQGEICVKRSKTRLAKCLYRWSRRVWS